MSKLTLPHAGPKVPKNARGWCKFLAGNLDLFRAGARLIIMQSGISEESSPYARLREEYRSAFNEWAFQVNHLHAVIANEPQFVREAQEKVAMAELAYRNTRNRLIEGLAV